MYPRFCPHWILVATLLSPLAARAERTAEVDVVVDMTPEGHRVDPPTAAHPAYYYPILGGYQTLGAVVAGEPPPPSPLEVAHLVAVELARQGYFASKAQTVRNHLVLDPPPTLVIAVHWGCLNPVNQDLGSPIDPNPVTFNQDDMMALVGGDTLNNLDLNFEREGVIQAAEQNRYFVVLTAFDLRAYQKTHRRIKLWQAKMSVPSNAVTLDAVLPTLVKAGGPFFGRETVRPKMLIAPVLPEARVEIGTPTVKDYQEVPLPAPGQAPGATAK